MVKILHQREKCIGCNSCVEHAPNNWSMSTSDGKSCLKNSKKKKEFYISEISPDEIEENERAARDCPVNIITVVK